MNKVQINFHRVVQTWFEATFACATRPQLLGWPAIEQGGHVLISAPTGSGKTLAAFLASIDRLFGEQLEQGLPQETRVLYVSPLKALSNDIHRNLDLPLREIAETAVALGYERPLVQAALRTGDTSARDRRKIIEKPPHILVTTPESLYLLLTSESGRRVLSTVRTLIVDEIHALLESRRGAHLALSIERLAALTNAPLQRIGLSATQKPMSLVAKLLVGTRFCREDGSPDCTIIDEGHLRQVDLGIEVPGSPLEAVMANEVWEEIYARLVELIQAHQTTLIFVNTRRLAERITWRLTSKLGEEQVASHHGSLSLDIRQKAERRLKAGELKVLVATASMELGIDIGSVDLVCQIGSSRSIATLLQRIGRSGHHFGGLPKGRIFPLTRDELVECTALLRSIRLGNLDEPVIQECPLDVLSQQMVAAIACEDWDEDQLLHLFQGAWLYRNLNAQTFKSLIYMLADGFTTKRGRRGAQVYYDGVNHRLKARKGARMVALTNGGAIPDNADYRVLQEPTGLFVGTLNEDFAIESHAGDIFRLGNNSWRIVKIENGLVRVEDAQGLPPTIPFWLGEAPSRTDELSRAISALRNELGDLATSEEQGNRVLQQEPGLAPEAIKQILDYLTAGARALGGLPTRNRIIIERFFDEAGGMQLVIHSLFGSRINRAWGLALRKRFCRSFNFELQAAATEDAIVLSLGPKHSFPLEDVFAFLSARNVREILIQAVLDAPMFQVRWRWVAARSLALIRQRGSRRIPPAIQRMEAEDLIAVVFPDQLACLENIAGDREVPDHPLVQQTLDDCLNEAMSISGLIQVLSAIAAGEIECIALDLPEPSPLCHEALNAQPYAFLDDAPLEERRTQAVYLKRTLDSESIRKQGLVDQQAVDRVREQAWPEASSADELHDGLLSMGAMPLWSLSEHWFSLAGELMAQQRVGIIDPGTGTKLLIPAERILLWQSVFPQIQAEPPLEPPERELNQEWDRYSAIIDLVRGFMELCGPTTAEKLRDWFAIELSGLQQALVALEVEGMILRGHFDQNLEGQQWCNRRLLARIHQLTIRDLRERTRPVSAHHFMRFLFQWHHLLPDHSWRQLDGVEAACELLEGFEAPAACWEKEILAARVQGYSPEWLDQLCLQGRISWARISPPKNGASGKGPIKTTPISLFPRSNSDIWSPESSPVEPGGYAVQVLEALEKLGASFFNEILSSSGLLHSQLEQALGELVSLGLVTCDSFAGLRALLVPANKRPSPARRARMRQMKSYGIGYAGRWSLLTGREGSKEEDDFECLEYRAVTLLRRYGVVFRKLLERESQAPPWRELLTVYRRMEAIGEIRGGRFVEGFSGEQFALPEAIKPLRSQKDRDPDTNLIPLNATDPLNLMGSLLPGRVLPQTPNNRVLYRDALPVATWEGGNLEILSDDLDQGQVEPYLRKKSPNKLHLIHPVSLST